MFVGVDVASDRLHWVAVDEGLRVTDAGLVHASETELLVGALRGAAVVAIDAPAAPSVLPHELDSDLAPKFRLARCAEVALGREHGIWVPWAAPAAAPERGWMAVGLELFARLAEAGVRAVEVYPYACFRLLAGAVRLPRKQTVAGVRARIDLLTAAGAAAPHIAVWTHDGLDALVAAITAQGVHAGTAVEITCGHDGSAIWVPGDSGRHRRRTDGVPSAREGAPLRRPRAPGPRGSRARPT